MDTVRNFFSPLKQRPDPQVDAQTPASQATTPWKKNEIQARGSLGRISTPAGNDRARSIASPAAIAAAKYTSDDVDDIDEPSQSEEHLSDTEMTGPPAARAPSIDLDLIPLTSPQARRSGRVSGAHLNSAIDAGVEEGDDDEQFGFRRFLDYRQTGNGNDIEIQVEWERGSPTWEPEINLHRDAPETLFAYWKSQGGRPLNPEDPELFDIFSIRKHSKNKKRLQVEWLGYDKSEWTWLPSRVVEETAQDVVKAYWEAQKNK